jgi:hypothetical protein
MFSLSVSDGKLADKAFCSELWQVFTVTLTVGS